MQVKKYQYPDVCDGVTIAFIRENEPFKGYWEKSENYILSKIKEWIQSCGDGSTSATFLDAGCGAGRLLPEFEPYFSSILAADPDATQIEKAKDLVEKHGFYDKVAFQVSPIERLECEKEAFDAILCSHVLQHVTTSSVQPILQRFAEILNPSGLLFITTTHSGRNRDCFAKACLRVSKASEEEIKREEFDSLVLNEKGVLPIHFFAMRTILRLLESSDLELADFKSYHVLCKAPLLDRIVDRDRVVNSLSFLRNKLGRDMLIVAQKAKNPLSSIVSDKGD
jgi:ubiquinone/menaquinone biosynthesis C-methylase UbiE